MFDNIGGKIKTLAKVVCWIGIIACIITGIVQMATDEDLVLAGILTAVVGSLLSWVSSFVLYGFGQLVENSDEIVFQNNKLIDIKDDKQNHNTPPSNSSNVKTPFNPPESQHKWKCVSCGEMISSNPCPYCGNNTQLKKESTAPYWCGKCGKEGPYEGNCPDCGSSLKRFNVQI